MIYQLLVQMASGCSVTPGILLHAISEESIDESGEGVGWTRRERENEKWVIFRADLLPSHVDALLTRKVCLDLDMLIDVRSYDPHDRQLITKSAESMRLATKERA